MITEAETKEIEKEAKVYSETPKFGAFSNSIGKYDGYIAGSTAMAERKNVEVEGWKQIAKDKQTQIGHLEKACLKRDDQLESTQEELTFQKEQFELADKAVISLKAELSRLKEVVQLVREFTEAQELGSGDAVSFQDIFKQALTLLEGDKAATEKR